MIAEFNKENENILLKEIKNKITEEQYELIKKYVDKYCEKCEIGSAISLPSVFGDDWSNSPMQVVYVACDNNHSEAAKYAGIIFKDCVSNNKDYIFEIAKTKNGLNCYYKKGKV